MAYQIALDIANRAIQHLVGINRIYSFSDTTPAAREIAFTYDKVRDAELRRNVWRFAIRRAVLRPIDTSTVIWTPAAWAAATTYAAGVVVNHTPAGLNISQFGANPVPYLWQTDQAIAGSATNSAPDLSTSWHRYFGPLTCDPFVTEDVDPPLAPTTGTSVAGALAARTYYVKVTYITTSGETLASDETTQAVAANSVLTVTSPIAATGATKYHVYMSTTSEEGTLQTGTGAITLGTPWTEPVGGMVLGRREPLAAAASSAGYFAGEITVLDATVYSSLVSSNSDVPPSGKWVPQGGTVAPLDLLYPIDAGPSNMNTGSFGASNGTGFSSGPGSSIARSVYRLPYGFLRKAPTDPTAGHSWWLGAPAGLPPEDWTFEGDYLTTRQGGPMLIRFVADMIDVDKFDQMFAEALSARIAQEIAPSVCERDTVGASVQNATAHYRAEMSAARAANAILIGSDDARVDPYILARM
jgi:hypothetical protein